MDKNTLIGFILMALVVIGFTWLNKPSEEELAARKAEQEQAHHIQEERNKNVVSDLQPYDDYVREIPETHTTLSNKLVNLEISNKGGMIRSAKLKDYNSFALGQNDTNRVELIRKNNSTYGFVLTTASRRFDTSKYIFETVAVNDSTVEMRLDFARVISPELYHQPEAETDTDSTAVDIEAPAPAFLIFRYTLHPESYIVTLDVIQDGMETVIPSSTVSADFNWDYTMFRNETGRVFEERNSSLSYKFLGDSPDKLSENKNDKESLRQRVKWIAFKNQFFSIVTLPKTSFTGAEISSNVLKDNPEKLKDMHVESTLDYSASSSNPISLDIFMGPNLYPLLASLDDTIDTQEKLQLTKLIPLGWPIVRWISTLIIIPVFTWLGTFISNYGIIILLLTLFIKIILFPFTYKSFISQAKTRVLAPEIKEINEKYPGQQNAMIRNQKTMELYNKAGANPMSGCLPMLLQMPILIAMFWFFPSCIELRGQSFLWAHNLAAPDIIATLPFTIPFYGNHVSLFCLLMTAVNIVYTRINMQNQPSSASMPGMKWMMYLMPLMFLVFFNDYAAGLSYYYLLSLLITIIMTYAFRLCLDEQKLRDKMMQKAAKPRKKSKWMERLEEAQKRQQAMLREQQKKNRR